jgi:hypothetical protein
MAQALLQRALAAALGADLPHAWQHAHLALAASQEKPRCALYRDPAVMLVGFAWAGADERKMVGTFGMGRAGFGCFVDLQVGPRASRAMTALAAELKTCLRVGSFNHASNLCASRFLQSCQISDGST